jgi:hypothetical protein
MRATAHPRFVLFILALASPALADAPARYDLTTETLMPHLEANLRYATTRGERCVSDDPAALFPILSHSSLAGCRLNELRPDGNTTSYTLLCTASSGTVGSARVTFRDDRLFALLEVRMGGKNMRFSQRVTGVRKGGCGRAGVEALASPLLSSPRLRGEDAGRQMRGGADFQGKALPLIRHFVPPSPRKRGKGRYPSVTARNLSSP